MADLADAHAGLVMAAIRDRMAEHAAVPGLRYSQAIINAGREAGASLEHPHGQLLAMSFVPREISDEQAGFARFEGSCLLCTTIGAEEEIGLPDRPRRRARRGRLPLLEFDALRDAGHRPGPRVATCTTPPRPTWPPWDGRSVPPSARSAHRLGDVAYNVVFHAAPFRSEGQFHWHVHLLPKVTTQAGFELGTGVPINICPPEAAADELRSSARV